MNERKKTARTGRLTVKDQIALRLGELMDQYGPSWAVIGEQLAAEGFSGNLITKTLKAQQALRAGSEFIGPVSDISDSAIAESEGPTTVVEAVAMAAREVIDRGAPATSQREEILSAVNEKVTGLELTVAGLAHQVGLINQTLQHLDPARLAKAVEGLETAKRGYEAPPLRQTVRDAAAEIRSGVRPPRRKLGVTVDGSLWAAVEEIQRRQRRTISEILDDALKLWVDHVSELS